MSDVRIVVDPSGKWGANESASNNHVQFELTALHDAAGLQDWLTTVRPVADRVKGISITHTTLAPSNIMKLLSIVLQDRAFRNLSNLDLSYCSIPEMAVNMLCEYINPFTGGYNITVLNATRCKLGYYGTTKLIEALYANGTLEEILFTGNNCTDKAIPYLHTALTKYKNKIETIGLGSNKLTDLGVVQLCSLLEQPGRPLKRLLLENNPDIGDARLDDLVIAINKGNTIETLSLSGCGVGSCEWARYLPFMGTLTSLDLSYNLIGDDEFGKLCKALERCYCLKHLDLAYNQFCGTNCNVIEQMLAANGALQSLSLRGNRCVDSVWDALHRGMLLNNTMLQLNLSDCNITVQNASKICKLFHQNDICTIDFSNNPLPPEFINSPRDQVSLVNKSVLKPKAGADAVDGERGLPVLQLSDRAHVLSMARSAEWCATRAAEVSLSLNSLCIVSDRQHLLIKTDDAGNNINSKNNIIGLPVMAHTQVFSAVTTTAKARAPQALTSPGTIAQSELYLSTTALREFVAESDLANTTERRVMHVAYGRAALVIGHIEITSLTTFAEAQLLVHPLVLEYVSTIAANPEVHGDLVSKYSLMDAAGLTLTKAEAQLRRVWPEFCAQAEPVIVVRPGNWVRL